MRLKGQAHKFGDAVNTDYIISGRYKFRIQDPKELAKHVMEDLKPDFYKTVKSGDFLVAGSNFGCGSSREQAPIAIKGAGIQAVIAKSFARIFFRNAINLGLLLIECDTTGFKQGHRLEVDTDKGYVVNKANNKKVQITPLPGFMTRIIKDGGVVKHFKKHGGFKL
ncbi:MAG: 3-isopropylmalate dehydratase small subunit [Candidatus Orphnella occulta]|nr:3-isopropylmalate dehydratase small subunit [Candidatus Orphnella occulta]MDP8297594.1 3-isopropylmalate dehydratase small subunit [Candidatus Orphnella occulta]